MANDVIIFMPDWKVNLVRPVVLGFSGENKRATLIIKSNVVDPDTAYYLDVLSNGTKNTIALSVSESDLAVELTSDMLGYSGRKQMQIRAVKNDTVMKSNIFNGEVLDSINASEDFQRTYPTVYDQYESQLSELNRLIEEVENLEPGGGGSGRPGKDGADGKSAYELAVENGFSGSETEWLLSLKGEKGDKGEQGEPGADGTNGKDGTNGIDGVNGKDGKDGTNGTDGKSAYQLAIDNGFNGSLSEWLESLKGADGKDGINGSNGKDGINGVDGKDGVNGENGKSAYELAVDNGFSGTLAEWLNSLKGSDGAKGDKGEKGDTGAQGLRGEKGDSGVEQQIVIDTAVTAYTIKPNILYVFPELAQLDISFDLTDLNPNIVNDFHFQFVNGSTPCELSFGENINVNVGDYEPQANGVCEISIVNGLMSYQNWSNE